MSILVQAAANGTLSVGDRIAAALGEAATFGHAGDLTRTREQRAAAAAAFFRRWRIVGQRGECSHCLVAIYLLRVIPELVWVEVEPADDDRHARVHWYIRGEDGHRDGCGATLLPPVLHAMAVAFDEGRYPDLTGED